MKTAFACLCLSLSTLVAGPLPGARAQEATSSSHSALPKRSDVTLTFFTPTHLELEELHTAALQLFGDSFRVSTPDGGWANVAHFIQVSKSLGVQETPQEAEKILATLNRLDLIAREEEKPVPVETLEYTPRHITIDSLLPAIDQQVYNVWVSPVEEKRILLVRGRAAQVAETRRLLAKLDVPSPQVTITCHLIRGLEQGTSSPTLPTELVENLRRILPMSGFELVSVGVLHAAVASSTIQLETSAGPGLSYNLQLQPSAYDAAEGTLTLASCFFQLRVGPTDAARSHELRTNLALRAGEYTVLGALGSEPIFVVLRVVPDPR